MLALSKLAETSSTLTLGWTPPPDVECYGFFANGQKVSTADDRNKDGSPRTSAKFSKTNPGPPYEVVALVRSGGNYTVDWGRYPATSDGVGDPYFVSDWDTVNGGKMGWPPWATLFQVGTPSTIDLGLYGGPAIAAAPNGRAAVVENPYGTGKLLRLEIRNTDPSTGTNSFQKEELGAYETVTWPGGAWVNPSEIWIGMELYLPDEFGLASGGSNPFTNLMDLHPSSNSGVPALGLGGYSTTNIQLYAGIPGSIQRRNFIDIGAANRNRKLTIVIGAKIGTSGGWVEAWLDGVNTIPRFNAVTAEASESGPYFKQGLYKNTDSSFPNGGCVVYFGRTTIGADRPF